MVRTQAREGRGRAAAPERAHLAGDLLGVRPVVGVVHGDELAGRLGERRGCARRSRRGSPAGGSAGSAGRRGRSRRRSSAVASVLASSTTRTSRSPWVCSARPRERGGERRRGVRGGHEHADPRGRRPASAPGSAPARLSRPSGRAGSRLPISCRPKRRKTALIARERRAPRPRGPRAPAAGRQLPARDQRAREASKPPAARAARRRARLGAAAEPGEEERLERAWRRSAAAGGWSARGDDALERGGEVALRRRPAREHQARLGGLARRVRSGGERREVAQARRARSRPRAGPRARARRPGAGGRSRARAQASSRGGMAARKAPAAGRRRGAAPRRGPPGPRPAGVSRPSFRAGDRVGGVAQLLDQLAAGADRGAAAAALVLEVGERGRDLLEEDVG